MNKLTVKSQLDIAKKAQNVLQTNKLKILPDQNSNLLAILLTNTQYQCVYTNILKDEENSIYAFNDKVKKILVINEAIYHDRNARNFWIAHELGHYFLNHEGQFFFKCNSRILDDEGSYCQEEIIPKLTTFIEIIDRSYAQYQPYVEDLKQSIKDKKPFINNKIYEAEANYFAACLLMPFNEFYNNQDKTDEELTDYFQLPIEAIERRRKEIMVEYKEGFHLALLTKEDLEIADEEFFFQCLNN